MDWKITRNFFLFLSLFFVGTMFLKGLHHWSYHYTNTGEPDDRLHFPRSIHDVKVIREVAQEYYLPHYPVYSISIFSAGYLFKQIFSLPGTVFLTMLSGAVLRRPDSWILCTLLQAIGSCIAYLISLHIWRPVILRIFPRQWEPYRRRVMGWVQSEDYWIETNKIIAGIRAFPLTPNFLMNLIAPYIGIPLWIYFLICFVGGIPLNYFLVRYGEIITRFDSFFDIFWYDDSSWLRFFGLIVVALTLADPTVLLMKYTMQFINSLGNLFNVMTNPQRQRRGRIHG